MPLAIGVDIGGTKIAAGVVDEGGGLVARIDAPTPANSPTDLEDTICRLVTQLAGGEAVASVGVGAAGWIERSGLIYFSPHVAWRRYPLGSVLSERLGLPVTVENDANAAAWAEYRFGAGQAATVLLCVTVGTGIGGGIVIGGQLLRGATGLAGEIGHIIFEPGGRLCGCGARGCWEAYASGSALAVNAEALLSAHPDSGMALRERATAHGGITGALVTAAAKQGDGVAISLLADQGRLLGLGLATVAAVLDPSVIVVGGGVSDSDDLLLTPAREAFALSMVNAPSRPAIVRARLGTAAGLVGAADLARCRTEGRSL